MDAVDAAALLLRVVVGVTIALHGWNHAFGPGGLAGTAGWFESMGLRPGRLHAIAATATELLGGVLLVLGLLTPLAAGAVLGTMVVAFVTAHRTNGFFIFKPGQGYEYVLVLGVVCLAIACLGGGSFGLDNAIGFDLAWQAGAAAAAGIGGGGAAALLAVYWRPASA